MESSKKVADLSVRKTNKNPDETHPGDLQLVTLQEYSDELMLGSTLCLICLFSRHLNQDAVYY